MSALAVLETVVPCFGVEGGMKEFYAAHKASGCAYEKYVLMTAGPLHRPSVWGGRKFFFVRHIHPGIVRFQKTRSHDGCSAVPYFCVAGKKVFCAGHKCYGVGKAFPFRSRG